ncbi:hypothetical protein C8J56DRAFT_961864, partial [Mycena floridula]
DHRLSLKEGCVTMQRPKICSSTVHQLEGLPLDMEYLGAWESRCDYFLLLLFRYAAPSWTSLCPVLLSLFPSSPLWRQYEDSGRRKVRSRLWYTFSSSLVNGLTICDIPLDDSPYSPSSSHWTFSSDAPSSSAFHAVGRQSISQHSRATQCSSLYRFPLPEPSDIGEGSRFSSNWLSVRLVFSWATIAVQPTSKTLAWIQGEDRQMKQR